MKRRTGSPNDAGQERVPRPACPAVRRSYPCSTAGQAGRGTLAFALLLILTGLLGLQVTGIGAAAERSYRLSDTDLKQQIIWGAACEEPQGAGLSFGGQDQKAEDGRPHTRIREGGEWKAIHEELRAGNPLEPMRELAWRLRDQVKHLAARTRGAYLRGRPGAEGQQAVGESLRVLARRIEEFTAAGEYERGQVKVAIGFVRAAQERAGSLAAAAAQGAAADATKVLSAVQVDVEKVAEVLDAEPPARALSPIVYDAKTKLYVLFGGDHLDYLTNDTWVFDPARKKWMQRHPPSAPPPRADHKLKATGDGKVLLSGGYAYTSNTDYCGGQYKTIGDGEWVYDVAANSWTGAGKSEPPDARVYRTGPFHPDFYLADPKPDAAAVAARLKDLPANTWVAMNPPHIPRLDRCWGTVALDPDGDQVLVWAGGHSSHGGTDVLHYHLATNRWELPYPVEFPLGQLYANTNYPRGFSFNLRPWITGHTYQDYAYDLVSRKLVFTGQRDHYYVYDPEAADWVSRAPKPPGMVYGDCFYTLTLCAAPQGLVCWTEQGKLFRYDPEGKAWTELPLAGKLPGASVDYSTVVYDSKRDRFLFFRCDYGKKYDGQVHAVDAKTLAVSALAPVNMAAVAAAPPSIDRACYDPQTDLVLLATFAPPDVEGVQRITAYDSAGNRWVSLKVHYDAPKKEGARVPGGPRRCFSILPDPRRKILWGVDAFHCQVYALRLDARTADVAELKP